MKGIPGSSKFMDDLLKYAVEHGMIDLSYVQEQIEMSKRSEVLKKHPYQKWYGKDGKWHTYLPDKEKGRVARKRNTEKELDNLIVEYWEEELENPTIKEVFAEWNDRRLSLEKISKATHTRNCQVFSHHYSDFGNRKIKSIAPQDIEEFLEEQIPEHKLTGKAFSNLKTITRGFLKRAKKRRLIDFNVEEMLQELDVSDCDFKKTIKEDFQEVYNDEEMEVMIKYLGENLDVYNMAILLMFVTGMRVGEVVALKRIDLIDNIIKVRRTETRYRAAEHKFERAVKEFPKTHAGVRDIVVPNGYMWLISKIRMINPFGEYVFVNKSGERLGAQSIRIRLKRTCDKLGIFRKSPHKIRKTYGTILLDNNLDKRLIIGQMGHTDVACTERHYHRNRRTIEEKTPILSDIPEFAVKKISSAITLDTLFDTLMIYDPAKSP